MWYLLLIFPVGPFWFGGEACAVRLTPTPEAVWAVFGIVPRGPQTFPLPTFDLRQGRGPTDPTQFFQAVLNDSCLAWVRQWVGDGDIHLGHFWEQSHPMPPPSHTCGHAFSLYHSFLENRNRHSFPFFLSLPPTTYSSPCLLPFPLI